MGGVGDFMSARWGRRGAFSMLNLTPMALQALRGRFLLRPLEEPLRTGHARRGGGGVDAAGDACVALTRRCAMHRHDECNGGQGAGVCGWLTRGDASVPYASGSLIYKEP